MEKRERGTRSRPAAGRPANESAESSKARSSALSPSGSFWVTVQGHAVSVHSGASRPNGQHAEGERSIQVEGPYPTEDAAEKRAERLRANSPIYKGSSKEMIGA